MRDFSAIPVIKNLPSSAGDTGLIPGGRTKIPHSVGQLSPWATTEEAMAQLGKVHMLQQRTSALQQRSTYPYKVYILYKHRFLCVCVYIYIYIYGNKD